MFEQTDKTIILVEDDEGCMVLTRRYLERAGVPWPIIHFSHGSELLEFLCSNMMESQHGQEYVVILDVDLPDTSGVELLGIIRSAEMESVKRLPVIMHTNSSDEDNRSRCHELGADAYCRKDFSESFELADALKACMVAKGMAC